MLMTLWIRDSVRKGKARIVGLPLRLPLRQVGNGAGSGEAVALMQPQVNVS